MATTTAEAGEAVLTMNLTRLQELVQVEPELLLPSTLVRCYVSAAYGVQRVPLLFAAIASAGNTGAAQAFEVLEWVAARSPRDFPFVRNWGTPMEFTLVLLGQRGGEQVIHRLLDLGYAVPSYADNVFTFLYNMIGHPGLFTRLLMTEGARLREPFELGAAFSKSLRAPDPLPQLRALLPVYRGRLLADAKRSEDAARQIRNWFLFDGNRQRGLDAVVELLDLARELGLMLTDEVRKILSSIDGLLALVDASDADRAMSTLLLHHRLQHAAGGVGLPMSIQDQIFRLASAGEDRRARRLGDVYAASEHLLRGMQRALPAPQPPPGLFSSSSMPQL